MWTFYVVGVDDWAWRKGHRYGTIIVDLQARQIIELIPDRKPDSIASFLALHPSISVLTRDRSSEYALGMRLGAPQALQVADRWHLLRNLSQMVERLGARWRAAKGNTVAVSAPSAAYKIPARLARSSGEEELRNINQAHRWKQKEVVHHLYRQGFSMQRIADILAISKTTTHRLVHKTGTRERARQASILDPYIEYLERRWEEGCENGYQLWRELTEQGFTGSKRQVSRWAYGKRTKPAPSTPIRYRSRIDAGANRVEAAKEGRYLLPKPKTLASLFVRKPSDLSAEEFGTLKAIIQEPSIKSAYEQVQQFAAMIRGEQNEAFIDWFERARESGIRTISHYASNLFHDKEAVIAAMRMPWSNGQVEGQINKLKLIKRQMYGRAGFNLLRQRMLYKYQ